MRLASSLAMYGTGMDLGLGQTQFDIYLSSQRRMSLTSTGGSLHGAWVADGTITTSDMRRKRDVKELAQSLPAASPASRTPSRGKCSPGSQAPACQGSRRGDGSFGPLLRSLRPVSYHYKDKDHGPSSADGEVRFGFLADELERSLPQVVRSYTGDGGRSWKGVVYQDMIAVLTAALKEQQARLEEYQDAQAKEQDHQQVSIKWLMKEVRTLTSQLDTVSVRLSKETDRRRTLEFAVDGLRAQVAGCGSCRSRGR